MKKPALITLLLFSVLIKLKGQDLLVTGGVQVIGAVEGRLFLGGLLEIEAKKSEHFSIYSRVGYNAQDETVMMGIPVQYQLFNLGTGFKYYIGQAFEGLHFKGGFFYASEYVDYDLDDAQLISPGPIPVFTGEKYAGLDIGLGYSVVINNIYLGYDVNLGYNLINSGDGFIGFTSQVGYRF